MEYFYNTLEPGLITTLRQLYSAYTGVPYKGRVYDMQDVLMGLATGIKPYDVDVNKTIDFLIGDYTKIRSKAFDASDMYDTNVNNENGEIEREFINIQRNVWREQRRIWRAFQTAKKFGVTNSTLRKELRERNVSWSDVQKIISGKFDPIPYSKPRFEGKLKEIKALDKEFNKNKKIKRTLNKRSFYPRSELDRVLRFLRGQRLDQEFRYDKITVPTIHRNDQTSLVLPTSGVTGTGESGGLQFQTPPLGTTPQPVVNNMQMASAKDPITNLTGTEEAVLSPMEKVIAGRT